MSYVQTRKARACVLAPGKSGYAGDNVYSPDGSGVQSVTGNSDGAQSADFGVAMENDGQSAASVRVSGPSSSGGWNVVYRAVSVATNGSITTQDVTSQITGGGWISPTALRGPTQSDGNGARDAAQIQVEVRRARAWLWGHTQETG